MILLCFLNPHIQKQCCSIYSCRLDSQVREWDSGTACEDVPEKKIRGMGFAEPGEKKAWGGAVAVFQYFKVQLWWRGRWFLLKHTLGQDKRQ